MNVKCCYKMVAAVASIAVFSGVTMQSEACTRAVYLGSDGMPVTRRVNLKIPSRWIFCSESDKIIHRQIEPYPV